jgi:hypothetical protein
MSNADGHTSELRCSLPIHILDHALLEDARASTRLTRRLLFGLDAAERAGEGEQMELPSYPAHIMDRVPGPDEEGVASGARGSIALDWVNSQLMMDGVLSAATTPPESRVASRAGSRAASPERGVPRERERATSQNQSGQNHDRERGHHHHHHSIFSLRPFTKVASTFSHQSQSRPHAHAQSHQHDASPSPTAAASSLPVTPISFSRPQTPPSSGASASPMAGFTPLPPDDPLSRVPHYNIASRGFLGGGVTPLSSMRGLPSYEEASGRTTERSLSEGDLARRFASAMGRLGE